MRAIPDGERHDALADWCIEKVRRIEQSTCDDSERELRLDAANAAFCELSENPPHGRQLTVVDMNRRYKDRLVDARRKAGAQKRGAEEKPLPLSGDGMPLSASGECEVSSSHRNLDLVSLDDPLYLMEAAERAVEQKAALAGLPKRMREVLWLTECGYDAPEIAAYQGRSAEAVRADRVRGRRALSKATSS